MAAPTVTSITPSTGSVAGGAVVLIIGTNFTTATSVIIGGIAATGLVVISDTRVYAITPTHSAGLVDVAVVNPDGTGTGTNLFTYTAVESPVYNLYLWDDCCHIFLSQDTGNTFIEGCTPGAPGIPAPQSPGIDPHGVGTILDPWTDGQMAINDADYTTFVGVDNFYNSGFSIIAVSLNSGQNGTYTLVDPEPNEAAFISDFDSNQFYFRAAISEDADVILVPTYSSDPLIGDAYPRISTDRGETWNNVTGVPANLRWSAACFSSTASEIMYLQEYDTTPSAASIYKSTDWGTTWNLLTNSPLPVLDVDGAEMRLKCSADGQTVIRIENTGSFWISQDEGATWNEIDFPTVFSVTSGNNFSDCAITPDGNTIVVSFEQILNGARWPAVFISTNGGSSFSNISGNLIYPASVGPPSGGAPGTVPTGCTQCSVSPDGLGVIVTFLYGDGGITQPDGLVGKIMYVNVSVDSGSTFKLCAINADPYQSTSLLGKFTGIYITPYSSLNPPTPSGNGPRATVWWY